MTRRGRWIAIATIAVALTFLIGNIMLFNALPKPKRVTIPVSIDFDVADPRFRRSMDHLLKQPVRSGNHIDLLRDGEAIYDAMIDAIDAAEHSVTFETYEFWGPESAGRFADALSSAARRGVAVHAIIDFIGSRQADPDKFDRLAAAGVRLVRWREPRWYQLSRFNHRTHRKLLITDGHTGFIGGANIADNWLPGDDRQPYRDNHFRITGPVVGSMQAAFIETWLDASGYLLVGDPYFPELAATGRIDAQVVNSAPREGRHRVRKMLLYAIAAASDSITASTAYFYPDADFLDALTAAAERGVDVRILVPGNSIDQGYLRHASVNRWRPMLEAGVRIHEYQPRMYHSKLISIDDHWASIGSTNLDNRSFRINDEANVNVYDTEFARRIRELIEEDMAESEPYDLARWLERPWHKRLIGWASMTIGAHL
jgi:cardiolipin synthase A/B